MSRALPNVVFILSDQHNAKVLGHEGHPDVRTPNLDDMAANGVRFSRTVCQNPICTPSRVSWLSGQYCHNHGYYGLEGPNPKGLPSILGHFRAHGYTTAAIGKIHCPEYWIEDDSDRYRETRAKCSVGGSPYYDAYLKSKGAYQAYEETELVRAPNGSGQILDGFCSGQTYRDSPEGWSATESIRFMEDTAESARPFFLHLSFPKPHQTYTPTKEFWDLYRETDLTLPPNADYDLAAGRKAPHLIEMANGFRNGSWTKFEPRTFEAGRLRKLRGYLGNISQVDHAVGEVRTFLKESGLADNTIVIYSSDHGDYAVEHGIMEKAPGICSDAITRIPFIWEWSGHFTPGAVRGELAEAVDLAPTLCELAGLPGMPTADGISLAPTLVDRRADDGNAAPADQVASERQGRQIAVTENPWSKSVRADRYRLVYYPKEVFAKEYPDGFGELYDLENDPWEMKNLFFDPDYRMIAAQLREQLFDWLVTTTRIRTMQPQFRRNGCEWNTRYGVSTAADGKIGRSEIGPKARGNYT